MKGSGEEQMHRGIESELTSRVYSWTLALRWASRLMTLCTTSLGPSLSPPTRSHRSMIAPQSSDVRFSSVALPTNQRPLSEVCFPSGRKWRDRMAGACDVPTASS